MPWKQLLADANSITPQWAGVIMAMLMSILRVIYDNKEASITRIFLEALICGALSLTASYGISAMGLNASWAVFTGGMIGYFGSTSVRVFVLKYVTKKIDK